MATISRLNITTAMIAAFIVRAIGKDRSTRTTVAAFILMPIAIAKADDHRAYREGWEAGHRSGGHRDWDREG